MPALKDYLSTDIHNVFFNIREFASEELIDGQPMLVMIDDEQLQKHNLKSGGEGLAMGELLFHAKKADFVEDPFVEKRMMFNNSLYEVLYLSENAGVYTITLKGYHS
ncbi:hypothetical protein [Peribacillus phoenicis]|uniref:hypothetical protein n=1 Tax=unclassified Peribacillus TaxID=2675266 RepID=UPI00399FB6C7